MWPLLLAAVFLVASANGQTIPELTIEEPSGSSVAWVVGDSDRSFRYCMTPGVAGYRLVLNKEGGGVSSDKTATDGTSYCMTMNFPTLTSAYFAGDYTFELISPDNNTIVTKQIKVTIAAIPTVAGVTTTTTPPPTPVLRVNIKPPVAGDTDTNVKYCMKDARPGFFLALFKNGEQQYIHEAPGVYFKYCVRATLPLSSADSWVVRLLEGTNEIEKKEFTLSPV